MEGNNEPASRLIGSQNEMDWEICVAWNANYDMLRQRLTDRPAATNKRKYANAYITKQ